MFCIQLRLQHCWVKSPSAWIAPPTCRFGTGGLTWFVWIVFLIPFRFFFPYQHLYTVVCSSVSKQTSDKCCLRLLWDFGLTVGVPVTMKTLNVIWGPLSDRQEPQQHLIRSWVTNRIVEATHSGPVSCRVTYPNFPACLLLNQEKLLSLLSSPQHLFIRQLSETCEECKAPPR